MCYVSQKARLSITLFVCILELGLSKTYIGQDICVLISYEREFVWGDLCEECSSWCDRCDAQQRRRATPGWGFATERCTIQFSPDNLLLRWPIVDLKKYRRCHQIRALRSVIIILLWSFNHLIAIIFAYFQFCRALHQIPFNNITLLGTFMTPHLMSHFWLDNNCFITFYDLYVFWKCLLNPYLAL